ncbi:hypothetical protein L1887_26883, partial [Cichorium endivia]
WYPLAYRVFPFLVCVFLSKPRNQMNTNNEVCVCVNSGSEVQRGELEIASLSVRIRERRGERIPARNEVEVA